MQSPGDHWPDWRRRLIPQLLLDLYITAEFNSLQQQLRLLFTPGLSKKLQSKNKILITETLFFTEGTVHKQGRGEFELTDEGQVYFYFEIL